MSTSIKFIPKIAFTAIALTTLLSACSGNATDPTTQASTPAESPTMEESTPTPAEEPSATATDEATPTADETEVPPATEGPTPPSSGPLTGAKLDAAGIKWFGTYCTGVSKAASQASPDTKSMTIEQARQVAIKTYAGISQALTKTSADLAALPGAMNFEGSEAFAAFSVKALADVGKVYSDGSELIAAEKLASESELRAIVSSIEAKATAAGSDGFGAKSLDDSVKQSVGRDVPACGQG